MPRLGMWFAIDEVVHYDEVLRAACRHVDAGRGQRGLSTGDPHPGDDRLIEYRTAERQQLRSVVIRGPQQGDADAVRIEEYDRGGAQLIHVGEDRAETLDQTVGRGADQLEVDVELVRAHRHEQLLGREGPELRREAGVDACEVGAVDP